MTVETRRRTPEAACKSHGLMRSDGGLKSRKVQDQVGSWSQTLVVCMGSCET